MDHFIPGRQTLSAVWQEHMQAEFVHKDADEALTTMIDEPHVLCVGSGTGGRGRAEVREFFARHFLPNIPPDFELRPLSQVFGGGYVVEEFVVRFTHSLTMDWMLPGVPATDRKVEVAVVAVIRFEDGKIAHEHLYWDQATVLSQIGMLGHPVARAGMASAAHLLLLSEGRGIC
ncbi:MAG TPA: nuclear transport factor 2 family protein [Reyranella sp.]|nr:nuclear transport factor 2 family protein [Reyranella sp.]